MEWGKDKNRTARSPGAWLFQEYQDRKTKNPKYSLRAFASFLGLPPGRLSEIFSEKRQLSPKLFKRIVDRLGYSHLSYENFILPDSFEGAVPLRERALLSDDEFQVIAEWQHFAILSLLNTKNLVPTIKPIAARLGLSILEVRKSLLRLERLGLVRKEGLKWARTGQPLRTSSDIVSQAIRQAHRQMLERCIESLENVPVDQRDISSLTMAIDTKHLAQAKKLVKEFQNKMERLLETGHQTEVYYLGVQLIPLTRLTPGTKS